MRCHLQQVLISGSGRGIDVEDLKRHVTPAIPRALQDAQLLRG